MNELVEQFLIGTAFIAAIGFIDWIVWIAMRP